MPSISYAITVCNEDKELRHLVNTLLPYVRQIDEIVIQADEENVTPEVQTAMKELAKSELNRYSNVKLTFFPLSKDFATYKNNLKNCCTKDYVFFIDADEYPDTYLLEVLPKLLKANTNVDLFLVARINTVEGITPEHIKKWGWRVNDDGWINHPDYQTRIIANKPELKWVGKVHEKIEGYKTLSQLPSDIHQLALHHPKTIDRQEKQNAFYSTI